MQRTEVRAAGETAAVAFGGAVDHVQRTHRAIAARAFGIVGRATAGAPGPTAWLHDRIADGVYAAVRGIGVRSARTVARAGSLIGPPEARSLAEHPTGSLVLGALNGAFGERFAADGDPLELAMTLRHRGHDLPLAPAALRRAFPLSSGRVAVLVHGLCLTEASWRTDATDDEGPFAQRLRHELGYDVVALRYNSGRRIPANGAELATLLERLCAAWPAEGGVRELVLIGHSMGGLVCRSACAVGAIAGHHWIDPLRHVVTLGTPHLGANLERASATVAWAADLLPETRIVADLLDLRSDGVLDLRDGSLVHDDVPLRSDRWPWGERGTAVPLLEGVRHHAVGVTLARDPSSWLARTVVGDLLVTPTSAAARARGERRLAFPEDDVVVLGGLSHFDLLHHPRVYEHLRHWLRPAAALPAADATGSGLLDATADELPR